MDNLWIIYGYSMDTLWLIYDIPSGNDLQFAIENGHL